MERRRLSGELQRAQCEPDRMAREGRRTAAAGGRRNRPGIKWRRAQRELALTLRARAEMPHAAAAALPFHVPGLLKLALALAALLALAAPALAGDPVLASRVWPAEEYTRVTIETAQPVKQIGRASCRERVVDQVGG